MEKGADGRLRFGCGPGPLTDGVATEIRDQPLMADEVSAVPALRLCASHRGPHQGFTVGLGVDLWSSGGEGGAWGGWSAGGERQGAGRGVLRRPAGRGCGGQRKEEGSTHQAPGGQRSPEPPASPAPGFQCEPQPELWMRLLGFQLPCMAAARARNGNRVTVGAAVTGAPNPGPCIRETAGRWAGMTGAGRGGGEVWAKGLRGALLTLPPAPPQAGETLVPRTALTLEHSGTTGHLSWGFSVPSVPPPPFSRCSGGTVGLEAGERAP